MAISRTLLPVQSDNFGLLLGLVDFVLVVALSAEKGGNCRNWQSFGLFHGLWNT